MPSLISCLTRITRLVYAVANHLCAKNGQARLCHHWSHVWQEGPGSFMSSLFEWREWLCSFLPSLIACVTRMTRLVYAVTDRLFDKNGQVRLCRHWSSAWQEWPGSFMSSLIVCLTRIARLVFVVTDRLCDKNCQACLCRHWSHMWQEWPSSLMPSLIVCVTRMARLVYVLTDRLCDKNGQARLCPHWSSVWQE